jgi:hypothetical protein
MRKSCSTCGEGFSFGIPADHRNGCPKDNPGSLGEYLTLTAEDKMKLFKAKTKRERRKAALDRAREVKP